jgi:hypothetical protein
MYHVKWEIELDAHSHREAAEKAQNVHRYLPGVAEVFEVTERLSGATITIDLADPAS